MNTKTLYSVVCVTISIPILLFSHFVFAQTMPIALPKTPASVSNTTTINLNTIDYSKWNDYAANIKNCTPGVFQVPNILLIYMLKTMQANGLAAPPISEIPLMTFQITGMVSNKCQVKVTMTYPQGSNNQNQSQARSYNLQCAFPSDSLNNLSNWATSAAKGNLDVAVDESISKTMNDSCK